MVPYHLEQRAKCNGEHLGTGSQQLMTDVKVQLAHSVVAAQ
jgi:hypothetical protein